MSLGANKRALVVDDDANMARACARLLTRLGFRCTQVTHAEDALVALGEGSFALILSDIVMPGMDGVEFLRKVRANDTDVPFLLMTGYGTIKSAVAAMQDGATNFLTKPFEAEELEDAVRHALSGVSPQPAASARAPEVGKVAPEMLGASPAMDVVRRHIAAASRTIGSVLILGASGTGKELVARAIHAGSSNRRGAFVPVNCGGLPEGLAESELFGNVKGAFTGAGVARDGLFRAAQGGTIFLDEIGEMPPDLQVKLLRTLQESAVRPVGGTRELPLDVRVISATNLDPKQAVADGRLREDLYYRLAVLTVEIPSLRERTGDVRLLAEAFLHGLQQRYQAGPDSISPEALAALEAFPWPGNVRQLENVLEQAVAMNIDAPAIEREHLSREVREGVPALGPGGAGTAGATTIKEGEALLIRRALDTSAGNKTHAARALGITRPLLYKRMKEYGID